jgi:hypothetical protein
LPDQGSKAFLVLPLIEIEDETTFTQIGVHKGQAHLLLIHCIQGSQMPGRVAAGRFDLDHLSAKIAQDAADRRPDGLGNIEDA